MFYFITQMIFFLSLGVIIFLLSQKLPLIEENSSSFSLKKGKKPFYFLWFEVLDKKILSFLSLFLRKVRLWVMRLDNLVGSWLEKVNQKSDFRDNKDNLIKEIVLGNSNEKAKKDSDLKKEK